MGDVVVDGEFDPLRINQQQPDILGCRLEQNGRDEGVDGDRLARTGGAGDEQMGHAGEVGDDRPADDIEAERQTEHGGGLLVRRTGENIPQKDCLANRVGDLDADGRLAGNGTDDAHPVHLQDHGQVIGQGDDLVDLHPRRRREFVGRHHRPRGDARHRALDTEVQQLGGENIAHLVVVFSAQLDFALVVFIEQGQGRQLEGGAAGTLAGSLAPAGLPAHHALQRFVDCRHGWRRCRRLTHLGRGPARAGRARLARRQLGFHALLGGRGERRLCPAPLSHAHEQAQGGETHRRHQGKDEQQPHGQG